MQMKEMEAQIKLLNDRQIDPLLIEEIKDTERLLKKQIFEDSINNNKKLNNNINSTKIALLQIDDSEANISNMSNNNIKNDIDYRRENNMYNNEIKGSKNGENHFSVYNNNSTDRAFQEISSDNSFLLFDSLSKKKILHNNNNSNNNNDNNNSYINYDNNSNNDIENIYINRNNKDVRSYSGMQYSNTASPLLPNDLLAERRFRRNSPEVVHNKIHPRNVDFNNNNNDNNNNNHNSENNDNNNHNNNNSNNNTENNDSNNNNNNNNDNNNDNSNYSNNNNNN